jgi:prephenate dehydratase
VKYVTAAELKDAAGIAPELAAVQYGAQVIEAGIEDHAENYTRFHLLLREDRHGIGSVRSPLVPAQHPNKSSVAFSVVHEPGTLVRALDEFARAGVNLTKIESRPVHGSPWEYIFFVDLRYDSERQINQAMTAVHRHCRMFRELGRYPAA